jgi:alcohol dehydrogenase
VLPDSISDEHAVFTEPLAAACEVLSQIDIRNLSSAAVLGDGKLAQLIARVLVTKLRNVVMYGKHENKLVEARKCGVETKLVSRKTRNPKRTTESYRLVVEATGSPSGLMLAQNLTEPRGTLVLKSTFHGAAPVETWPIVVKEITLIGSRCGPFLKALALLRSGEVDPRPLISRIFPLPQADSAVQLAQKKGVMKVLLKT